MADARRPLPRRVLRFIDRFDRAEYWLSHEELEEQWMEDRRDCYKGLIHIAAALLHAERGNRNGAATKMGSALDYLLADPDCPGFDGEALVAYARQLERTLPESGSGDQLAEWAASRPPLRPLFRHDVPDRIAPDEELPYRVRRHDEGYRVRRDPRRRD